MSDSGGKKKSGIGDTVILYGVGVGPFDRDPYPGKLTTTITGSGIKIFEATSPKEIARQCIEILYKEWLDELNTRRDSIARSDGLAESMQIISEKFGVELPEEIKEWLKEDGE